MRTLLIMVLPPVALIIATDVYLVFSLYTGFPVRRRGPYIRFPNFKMKQTDAFGDLNHYIGEMMLEVHITKISVRSKKYKAQKQRYFFISVLLHLELADSGPTARQTSPGWLWGCLFSHRLVPLPRSAPPADGVVLNFQSGLSGQKTGWAALEGHLLSHPRSARSALGSQHCQMPRGCLTLLEVPRGTDSFQGTRFGRELSRVPSWSN